MKPFYKNSDADSWRVGDILEAPAGAFYLHESNGIVSVCRLSNGGSVALAAVVKERTDPVFTWRDVAASWLGMPVPLIIYTLKTFVCK